jgi:sugar phosphate isomerase/epimerase
MPPFSLAHLTALDLPPPEVIGLAAEAGYDHAGLRLLPTAPGSPFYPMAPGDALMRETLARIADTGVTVLKLELIRLAAGTDLRRFVPFLEAGAALEASSVLVIGDDPEEARLTESFAALCDLAAPYGLGMELEFMPWSAVPDLASAMRVVGGAARPNGGVLVDPLHLDRSGGSAADLTSVPARWMRYLQICDGPAERPATIEAMIHAARQDRMLPGEGGLDLHGIFAALPRGLPISIEVPTPRFGPRDRARLALQGARVVIEGLPG